MGNREANLNRALELLQEEIGLLEKRSSFYYSSAVGYESEHDFCNLCARFETTLSAEEVLARTQQIERLLGRERKSEVTEDGSLIHFDRTIDIDILMMGNLVIDTPELTLPHPRMYERDFVTIPLREVM